LFTRAEGVFVPVTILADNQKVTLTTEFINAEGNLARVDGSPEWDTSNEDLFKLTPASDGNSCEVEALGPLGTGQVSVTADADLGDGVRTVSGVVTIEVVGSEAVVAAINVMNPQRKD
jgi:hypothetical protein